MARKYPRTLHLPWSETIGSDDKRLKDVSHFDGLEVVVTIKRDGENSTIARNYSHARSLDSVNHPSRDWLKKYHSTFAHDIPENMRICGENLFAKHSILYTGLHSYFEVFNMWEDDTCLSWNLTEYWSALLDLCMVPIIYRGIFDKEKITSAFEEYKKSSVDEVEGYVVRTIGSFSYDDFSKNVAKFVRANHVQTDSHWMTSKIVPNVLIGESSVNS